MVNLEAPFVTREMSTHTYLPQKGRILSYYYFHIVKVFDHLPRNITTICVPFISRIREKAY